MKKNKIGVLLLLAAFAASIFVLPGSAGGVNPVADYYEDFQDKDIDGIDIVWAEEDDACGTAPVYDQNEKMYAIKTWVSPTRPVRLTHTFENAFSKGMFYLSFDYCSEDGWNDCYLRLLSGDTQFQICGFRNNGKFGHFLEFSKWALDGETAVDYQPDTWYTVGILFDMDARESYFYFGEKGTAPELIERVDLTDGFTGITDAVLVHSFGEYPVAMWDNLRLYTVTTESLEAVEEAEALVFDPTIYEKYLRPACLENFESKEIPGLGFSEWGEENAEHGIYHTYDTDGNGVIKTRVNSVYPKRLTHALEKPIDDGLWYITFDFKSEGGVNDCYLRLLSGTKQFQICGFRSDGNFGQFTNFSAWSLADETEVPYAADTWYTIGALLDMDLRRVSIYIGEKGKELSLCANAALTETMTSFTDIVLVHSFGNYPEALWDNLEVYPLCAETATLLAQKKKVPFDTTVTQPFACVMETENPGNIFHNAEDAELFANYYNRSLVYEKLQAEYTCSYGDETLYEESVVHVIKRGKELVDAISIPLKSNYGFFRFHASTQDDGVLCQTRFSNARQATDGVRNNKMGATVHASRVTDIDAAFTLLEKAGFGILRGGDNSWTETEPQKGVYVSDSKDTQFYQGATEHTFEVMTILSGSNEIYAAEYPTTNPDREGAVENPPQSDGLIEKFGEYCYRTVLMYPDVKYFQMWNEWNNGPTFNKDGITDASYYAKLLKAGYAGVKRAEKERGADAYVVAMAPTGTKADWIENVILASEGNRYFDVVSIHPYTYDNGGAGGSSTYAPEDVCVRHTRELGDVVTRIQRVRDVLDDYGFHQTPIWAGEFGFSSYICGEEKQAQYAVRMMALNDGNELLERMLWYTFQNHGEINETEQNYGMIRYDKNELVSYEAKPAYLAMSNYNTWMADAVMKEKISDGTDGVYVYRFQARDGNDLYLVWSTSGEKEVKLPAKSGSVMVYDLYGNERVVFTQNGEASILADESMTYVKTKKNYVLLTQDGKEITKLDALRDDVFYADASIEGYEKLNLLMVQYQDDVVTQATVRSLQGECVNLGKVRGDTDKICVFLWDDKLKPLTEKAVLQ